MTARIDRDAVAQSIERAASDQDQEVVGSISSPISTGWVGVSIIRLAETEVIVSPLCLCVAARKILRCQSCYPSAIA